MTSYDYVSIIYNPKSTNNAEAVAEKLATEIDDLKPELIATKYAHHAEKISYECATRYKVPLIISVSGDGGYNEVVNGAMKAKNEAQDRHPVVAVIGAGNANDHSTALGTESKSFAETLRSSEPRPIDLLEISAGEVFRYAHSYIGFGISAQAGAAINESKKGGFGDIVAVTRTIIDNHPIRVIRRGVTHVYDSLICFNIPRMAKLPALGSTLEVNDGVFDLHKVPHRSFITTAASLFHLALPTRVRTRSYRHYDFTLLSTSEVQFDGEIDEIPGNTRVEICSKHNAILTIY